MTPPPYTEMFHFECPHCSAVTYQPKDIEYGYCSRCKTCQADAPQPMTPASFPPIWVIYERPEDYSEGYVVRVHWGAWMEKRAQFAPTLELARRACWNEGGLTRLNRFEQDAPKILEYWL